MAAARGDRLVGTGGHRLPDGQDRGGRLPPSARDRREYTRMVQEKVEGFGLAAYAAVTTPTKDTATLVGNVLSPIHRRVVANRRRLSRS